MYRCAAGVGRTTLHKRYPTRADLVRAVASEALDLVDEAISGVDLGTDDAVDQLIARLVPLGPRVESCCGSRTCRTTSA
ncbi:hypothetical protein [Lentzea sp.]|uniref:hypothetical protein n=1 Tax=Lentzea sp. TaxID=56099 RepID=UPI002ED65839